VRRGTIISRGPLPGADLRRILVFELCCCARPSRYYRMHQPFTLPAGTEQHDRLQALYHLAVELSVLRDLQSVLDTALRHCLSLTDSQFGFIGLTTADGRALEVVAIQGFHPARDFYAHFRRIPLRPNIFARAVLERQPVRSPDAMDDPSRVGQPSGHPPVRAFLGVPLLVRDLPIGMIGVANRPTPYDEDHEQLLATYGAQVAIAIQNAQLYEALTASKAELESNVAERTQELREAKDALAQKATQLHQLLSETVGVQERERQRIAQDMHDGITQLLVGAMLELQSARERMAASDLPQAELSLQQVREVLRRVEAELRRLIYDLRPPTLDALGLAPSLRRYADRFQQYFSIRCDVSVVGEPYRLSPDAEIGVYRIMQEALQNVSAHARASRASVELDFGAEVLTVTIRDDGLGFEPDKVRTDGTAHFGLLSMQERVGSLGGWLELHSAPGQGTRVVVSVPGQAQQAARDARAASYAAGES
jgi:signal transduction histidine kinase